MLEQLLLDTVLSMVSDTGSIGTYTPSVHRCMQQLITTATAIQRCAAAARGCELLV
jgi:hypothetical protein